MSICALTSSALAEPASDPLRDELTRVRASQPAGVDASAFDSIAYQLDVAGRIAKDYPPQAVIWRERAAAWLKTAAHGQDPVSGARGQIVMRGYNSSISNVRQGYGIYLPKNYDPARAYPLMLVLHGGSANGNLFLGVVLGNNMNWKEYDKHLWDDFTPRYFPDWIVVAPDGFGQVMWRFMGEQDVLDVLADVQKHYHVDDNHVVLFGLSNGGVGAYSLGMRHAWRFSSVLAVAGAPSWLRYAGGKTDPLQAQAMEPLSAASLAENAINTDFRFYHGKSDPGPMRPAFVAEFSQHIATLGVPYREKWFDAGHDLLYLVQRRGALFDELASVVRNAHPKEVRVVTGDYRASRQHWLNVTRIERLPELARVRALAEGERIGVETRNTRALAIAWKDAPLSAGEHIQFVLDDSTVYDGPRSALANPALFVRDAGGWHAGAADSGKALPDKQLGSAGPITDAYYGSLVHVYGTGDPALSAQLRKSAERGARGWPLWLWRVQQDVLADTDVTDEILRTRDLVLYGTPGSNALLERIAKQLPIRVEQDAVVVGEQRFSGPGVGTKFIYPNPLAPTHYVIVQAGPTLDGVNGGHNLPDFLPDYAVYDSKTTHARPRLLFADNNRPLALGYFDAHWQLDPSHTQAALSSKRSDPQPVRQQVAEGNGPESASHDVPKSKLPVPSAPPQPPLPSVFSTAPDTQAGKAAREIARRVATFMNYRSKIPGATWAVDDAAPWSIREQADCLSTLEQQGVSVEAWTGSKLATPVATPVKLRSAVAGVTFRFMHAGAGVVISCELAARLLDLAGVLSRHGVHTAYVLSAYRDHPFPSFHTLGLALDLSRFDTDEGPLTVATDFVIDHDRETCDPLAPVQNGVRDAHGAKDRALRAIACELAALHRFSSVLTPNYNAGHRDHFHLDIRPDDPRFFVR
jgi:enterochelin esterase-like enzyme